MMKKHKYIFLLVAVLVTISCYKNDGPPALTTAELLAHRWVIVKGEDMSTSPPTVTEAGPCGGKWYFVFISDGTYLSESFYKDPNSNNCLSNDIETGTYELTSGEEKILLIVENPPITYTLNIVTLTSSELVISSPQEPEYYFYFKRATNP